MEVNFRCDELSGFTDSMLFDSGTNIAYGKFKQDEEEIEIFLDVCGEVSVTFKDEVYHAPSEFPDELKQLIRENQNQWMNEPDVYVGLNNWFEYIYENDGDVFEADVAKATPKDILEDMLWIAGRYFSRKELEALDLSVRSYNCLRRAGYHTIDDVAALTDDEIRRIRNLGQRCVVEIHHKLCEKGFKPNFHPDI